MTARTAFITESKLGVKPLPIRCDQADENRQWRLLQLLRNFVERCRSVGADGADSTQANNDDQSQHNSVFNCCWAVFTLQEITNLSGEILHGDLLQNWNGRAKRHLWGWITRSCILCFPFRHKTGRSHARHYWNLCHKNPSARIFLQKSKDIRELNTPFTQAASIHKKRRCA